VELAGGVKVEVVRDSLKFLVSPYRKFEHQFGGKTVLQIPSSSSLLRCLYRVPHKVSGLGPKKQLF
jgi:hypothetical protein